MSTSSELEHTLDRASAWISTQAARTELAALRARIERQHDDINAYVTKLEAQREAITEIKRRYKNDELVEVRTILSILTAYTAPIK